MGTSLEARVGRLEAQRRAAGGVRADREALIAAIAAKCERRLLAGDEPVAAYHPTDDDVRAFRAQIDAMMSELPAHARAWLGLEVAHA